MKLMFVLPMILLTSTLALARSPAQIVVEDGLIKVGSAAYEVAFRDADGSIAYVLDQSTQQNVSGGNSALWVATLDNDHTVSAAVETFSYSVDGAQLTLSYTGTVGVTITVTAGELAQNAGCRHQPDRQPSAPVLIPGESRRDRKRGRRRAAADDARRADQRAVLPERRVLYRAVSRRDVRGFPRAALRRGQAGALYAGG